MDMAVKSPSPSVHNPLLGDLTSPHNPLGIQVSKGVDTGFVNSNSKTDEGTEVARQVWDFVEAQCFPGRPEGTMMEPMVSSSEGLVDTANVTFWLRTLLQQNSDLVEVVAKLEAGSRTSGENGKLASKLEELEATRKDLEASLVESQGDNR